MKTTRSLMLEMLQRVKKIEREVYRCKCTCHNGNNFSCVNCSQYHSFSDLLNTDRPPKRKGKK